MVVQCTKLIYRISIYKTSCRQSETLELARYFSLIDLGRRFRFWLHTGGSPSPIDRKWLADEHFQWRCTDRRLYRYLQWYPGHSVSSQTWHGWTCSQGSSCSETLKNIYRLIFGALFKIHRCIFFKEGFSTFFEYFLLRIINAKYTTKSFLLRKRHFGC